MMVSGQTSQKRNKQKNKKTKKLLERVCAERRANTDSDRKSRNEKNSTFLDASDPGYQRTAVSFIFKLHLKPRKRLHRSAFWNDIQISSTVLLPVRPGPMDRHTSFVRTSRAMQKPSWSRKSVVFLPFLLKPVFLEYQLFCTFLNKKTERAYNPRGKPVAIDHSFIASGSDQSSPHVEKQRSIATGFRNPAEILHGSVPDLQRHVGWN